MWQQALYGVLTAVLMLGMGTGLSAQAFRSVLTRPLALAVGMACQLLGMPLLGAVAAWGLELPVPDAMGLMLMVTVGGGNASNMLTYLARADVALSLTMTSMSALTSMVTAPLAMAALATWLPAASPQPPVGAVALTLAMMAVPVPVGMWLRARHPGAADRADTAGRWAGLALVVVILGTSLVDHASLLAQSPGGVLLACVMVSGGGLLTGASVARVAGLPVPQRQAIAFEVGVQNLPAALAVIALAFPPNQQVDLQRVPLLYASVALALGTALWAFWRRRQA